jgi:predicted MFS family arabinose efflux permease
MSATTEAQHAAPRRLGLINRQLDYYPATGPRMRYLAITVLATITLYYELYVGGSVSTLILNNLHASFTFFAVTTALGSLVGAFGSLLAGLADRFGRANLVVFGLFFAAVFVEFLLPLASNKWTFAIEGFIVGFVEGICLVATPALIRDFSPQVGRATAMGFWTSGPVLGSLIVSIVGTATIPTVIHNTRFWTHEYRICGVAGIVVFLIAFFFLRELTPQLRDQVMVTMRDRALIEARATGFDIEAALRNPFKQLIKPDIVISAFAISVFLLIYYAAVGFLVIYMQTAFGYSTNEANSLANWEWAANAFAVILIGVLSDRLRVRKPFMLFGGISGAIMTVLFLLQFGRHPSYATMATILAISSITLGIAYVAWMASFTENIEARNPALIATGLAIWGWIIRIVVCVSSLLVPVVITSVTPLVSYGSTVSAYAAQYKAPLAFAQSHPKIVSQAELYAPQLGYATTYAPEIAFLVKNGALVQQASKYPQGAVPAKLQAQLIKAAGGGTAGVQLLTTLNTHQKEITSVISSAGALEALQPYAAQLTALSKVPPKVDAYLSAHANDVIKANAEAAGQWKHWWYVCLGGIIFFILSIPLMRGRWRPRDARADEAAHEAMVQAELDKLGVAQEA